MPRKLPRSGAHYHQCDRCGWQTGMRFAKPPRDYSAVLAPWLWGAAILVVIILLKLLAGDGGGPIGPDDTWRGP